MCSSDLSAPTPAPAPTPPPAAPAAPAAPAEYSPEQLFKAMIGVGRMDMGEKFPNEMADLTGAIAKINDDPVGEYVLEFDAGGGNVLAATILARDAFKGVKVGDTVHLVQCGLTMPEPTKLTVVNCNRK